jgi:hypothetical protein
VLYILGFGWDRKKCQDFTSHINLLRGLGDPKKCENLPIMCSVHIEYKKMHE